MANRTKPKITILGTVEGKKGDVHLPFNLLMSGFNANCVKGIDPDCHEPIRIGTYFDNTWVFRRKILKVEDLSGLSDTELVLLVKHEALKQERDFARIRKEVKAFENLDLLPLARRERIAEDVRMFVWQRDGGKCVKCGKNENLEFDHIIPVIEGGASTARNIQFLCQPCNRTKGRKV